MAEVVEILDIQRPVETEFMYQLGVAGRFHAAFAGHGLDRVAGNQMDQRKHK